jgi:hypothetical protein
MARSKSKHIRVIMKRRQRWKRRLKAQKTAKKAGASKK